MTAESWTCPFCGRLATLTDCDIHLELVQFQDKFTPTNKDELVGLTIVSKRCPNTECKKNELFAILSNYKKGGYISENCYRYGPRLSNVETWDLLPSAHFMHYPEYIPNPIIKDYEEACKIKNLSPKASATLARRCLQGMLRDFWKVSPSTLFNEINQIETQIDPELWEAIDSIRKIGNIGAHMEKDINLIIDVDKDEVEQLIGLIELLIEEWYIARHKKQQKIARVRAIGEQKEQDKADLKN